MCIYGQIHSRLVGLLRHPITALSLNIITFGLNFNVQTFFILRFRVVLQPTNSSTDHRSLRLGPSSLADVLHLPAPIVSMCWQVPTPKRLRQRHAFHRRRRLLRPGASHDASHQLCNTYEYKRRADHRSAIRDLDLSRQIDSWFVPIYS